MTKTTRVVSFTVALLLTVHVQASAAETSTPAAKAPEGTPATAPSGTPPPMQRPTHRTWWNVPQVVDALHLKEAQRTKMDQLLDKALETLQGSQGKQTDQRKAFDAALAKGDWKAARKSAAELREAMTSLTGIQMGLKIDVLALLDDSQRQTFFEKYSHILQRPWGLEAPMGRRVMRPGMMPMR